MSANGRHSADRRRFQTLRGQPRIDGLARLERPPDHHDRIVAAALVVAVLALMGLGALRLGPPPWQCPPWVPRSTPGCAPPPAHSAVEDYLTTTPGRAPAKYPEHADFLGLGDGSTPQAIGKAFPPGATHVVFPAREGRHRETWTWEGIHYVATVVEATGRTTGTYVFRDDDSPYYVAAPGHLLLGSTTVQDATYWNGAINRIAPGAGGSWYAEFSPMFASLSARTRYLAKADAAEGAARHTGPPYGADTAPCRAVLYLETVASPAQAGLGAVPSPREGENLSCR